MKKSRRYLEKLVEAAEREIEKNREFYTEGNILALEYMINEAVKALEGEGTIPFVRSRECVSSAETDPISFATKRYSMVGSYDMHEYGLETSFKWFKGTHIMNRLDETLALALERCKKICATPTDGSVGSLDPKRVEDVKQAIENTKGKQGEELGKATVKLLNAIRSARLSKKLRSDYEKNFNLFMSEDETEQFIERVESDPVLRGELDKIKGINRDAVMKAKAHWNGIAKPLHGLGLMEEIITQIAGIQNTVDVHIDKRAVIVMCADNGIVEEGVTQTGQDVTAVVSCNMADGISSVCRMAACSKTDVIPVNIGIAADKLADGTDVGTYKDLVNRRVMTGTRNFLKEPAMSQEQLIQAVLEGIKQVEWCSEQGYNILATGEMGIGNTTTSTALASILLNLEPEAVTGRGAGLDDSGLKRKVDVITKAKEMYGRCADNPLKLLQSIGGLDIAGLVGVYIGGAVYGIPVVADGVIATVAALIAVKLQPEINDYIIVSHQGKEPAMKALLDSLRKKAVIHAELALGEGTGAVMMFPLLDMALQVYRENTTFDDIQIAAYEDYGKC